MIKKIEAWYEPLGILNNLDNPICEMSRDQQGFLCELIRKSEPRKVVEIGVAEGGTTSVIMSALDMIAPKAKMYSVDLNKKLYYDNTKDTGYLLEEASTYLDNYQNHKMLLGKILPDVIDTIGVGIDFVVLDTVHMLPGELLDFLYIVPYLSEKAIVVLHDITLGLREPGTKDSICTGVLFNAVYGEKYWNYESDSSLNIGAICINEGTRESIYNVLGAMMLPWKYIPSDEEINKYTNKYFEYFTDEEKRLLERVIQRQVELYRRRTELGNSLLDEFLSCCIDENLEGIYIYGNGNYGRKLYKHLQNKGISIKKFVVSNNQNIEGLKDTIYLRDYVLLDEEKMCLYAIKDSKVYYELCKQGINITRIPDEIWELLMD